MRRQQEIQRRRELIDGYVAALGGADRVNAIQMVEIERVVDMSLLAEAMRARALRGEAIDIGELVRLEGAVSRVIRSLNLPPPGAAPVPISTPEPTPTATAASASEADVVPGVQS